MHPLAKRKTNTCQRDNKVCGASGLGRGWAQKHVSQGATAHVGVAKVAGPLPSEKLEPK